MEEIVLEDLEDTNFQQLSSCHYLSLMWFNVTAKAVIFQLFSRCNIFKSSKHSWSTVLTEMLFNGVFFPKDVLHQKMTETCATAHIGGVNIVLLEGITPNIQ